MVERVVQLKRSKALVSRGEEEVSRRNERLTSTTSLAPPMVYRERERSL